MTVGNYCDSVPRKIEIEIHKQKIKSYRLQVPGDNFQF